MVVYTLFPLFLAQSNLCFVRNLEPRFGSHGLQTLGSEKFKRPHGYKGLGYNTPKVSATPRGQLNGADPIASGSKDAFTSGGWAGRAAKVPKKVFLISESVKRHLSQTPDLERGIPGMKDRIQRIEGARSASSDSTLFSTGSQLDINQTKAWNTRINGGQLVFVFFFNFVFDGGVRSRKENGAFTKAASTAAWRQSENAGPRLLGFIFRRCPHFE